MKYTLVEDIIFYKFNVESETARKMIERYPPNEQQQHICDKLRVPYFLWSFYAGEILKHKLRYLENILYPLRIDVIEIPSNLNFGCMHLSNKEKRFISHHQALEEIRQNSVCVRPVPSRLVELCMNKIINETGHKELEERDWASLLPERFYREFIFYKRYLSGNIFQSLSTIPIEETEKAYFLDNNVLIDLFKERDKRFSKEFVIWFLNDERLCFKQFEDSHRLISIVFETNVENHLWCLACMKRTLRGYRIGRRLVRSYTISNVCSLNPIPQRFRYWCLECQQVPLFQILSLDELHDQYGYITNRSTKEELFF